MTPVAYSSTGYPMMQVVPHRDKSEVAANVSITIMAGVIVCSITIIIALTLTLLAGLPGYITGGLFLGIGHSNIALLLGKIAIIVGVSTSGITFLTTGALTVLICGLTTFICAVEVIEEISPPPPNADDAPRFNRRILKRLHRNLSHAN